MTQSLSRNLPAALVAAALALALAGCSIALGDESSSGNDPAPTSDDYDVVVTDMSFEPSSVEVEAGTEVTWLFDDSTSHDVVGDGWGSDIQRDGTFSHTFDEPGTYDYDCTLHGNMTGQVIVTE